MPIKPSDYNLKIIVGVPFAGRYVPPQWAMALVGLSWPMNIHFAYVPVYGMPREQAREELVTAAQSLRAEYLLMLDDDVTMPVDAIIKLEQVLEQRPEYDIIAAIVPSRSTAPEPMIFARPNDGAFWRWKLGQVFEIAEAATACMLIRTSVFNSVEKPWFRDLNTLEERVEAGMAPPVDVTIGRMTDDLYFCKKAVAKGHRILAHGGVLCTHWGRKGDSYVLPPDSYPFQPDLPEGDPVDGIKIQEALCINGWMSAAELIWLAKHARAAKEIVEIGSFAGRSTRAMAENTSGRVLAVDIWQLTEEIRRARDLPYKNGDVVFDDFRMNMVGLDNVHAMRLPSVEAAAQVPEALKFDMIFIDGNHSYEDCKADIEAWRPHLAPGGLLCGHDYDRGWPGVVKAVDELIPNAQQADGTIWYALPEEIGVNV